jgi:omega-6 fatty acid desaturase (delta-12 desaturase)
MKNYTTRDLRRERKDFFVILMLYTLACIVIGLDISLLVNLMASTFLAGLLVRSFCLLHELSHGSFLGKKSPFLTFIFIQFTRAITVSDAPSWKIAHLYHHRHLGEFTPISPGGIPILTGTQYQVLNYRKRITYHILRHPIFVILFAYFTIFMGISLYNFFNQPIRMKTAILPVVIHTVYILTLTSLLSFKIAFLVVILPCCLSGAAGGFLFFVQHIYPDANYEKDGQISSFIDFGNLINWFSANIGHHHIHHLNPAVPYYNLPKVQSEFSERIGVPRTAVNLKLFTTLFTARFWDEDKKQFSYHA